MKYNIGFEYTDRNKRLCKIIDYYITYNINNDIVKERYVVERRLLGQVIIDNDVIQTSIDMATKNTSI